MVENIPSYFEEKLSYLDAGLSNLRNGNWSAGLNEKQWDKKFYKGYYKILSEFETTLRPKMIPEEKEKLWKIKECLKGITTEIKVDYIIEDEYGNEEKEISSTTNYVKGRLILKKIEMLFRNVIERLTTGQEAH